MAASIKRDSGHLCDQLAGQYELLKCLMEPELLYGYAMTTLEVDLTKVTPFEDYERRVE